MKQPRALQSAREEARRWWRERSRSGARHATRRRAREQLGVEDLERRSVVMAQQLADERDFLRGQLQRLHGHLQQLQEQLGSALDDISGISLAQRGLESRVAELEHRDQLWSVMEYVRTVEVDETTLVSVVMATRNRSTFYLERAIESLRAQSYSRWELIVVDDGSEDETPAVLGKLDDERIRTFRIDHRGLAAARNRALTEVQGHVVTYLDDDNLLHPDWLRSIVWAFTTCPDVDVLYGATIIDDALRAQRLGSGGMPWLNFIRFEPERLAMGNIADIGAVAHRSGLPAARFDEDLEIFEDWDLVARLTREKEPLALPVLAGIYTTSAPQRLMARPEPEIRALTEEFRARLANRAP